MKSYFRTAALIIGLAQLVPVGTGAQTSIKPYKANPNSLSPPPPPPDPIDTPVDTPIDGGLSILLAAGVAYGLKKRHGRQKKSEVENSNA